MIARVAARHAQLWQDQWPEWRYRHLLPRAAASRAAGRRYALMVAAIELRDALRRRRAVARIERWQHVSRVAALRLFHACLLSEAREEADTVFFMRHPPELRQWFPDAAAVARPDGPTLFATLHLGSPIFAYLFLRSVAALDVRAIGRKLDERNPMPSAKRRYGLAKEVWLRGAAGVDLLEPSPRAMTDAREHLLAGRPLFAALDVPGDVVAHSARIAVAGEDVAFSAGAVRIARLARATIVPVVAISGPSRLQLHVGRALDATAPDAARAVLGEIIRFVHRFPGEWWLWPYLRSASS